MTRLFLRFYFSVLIVLMAAWYIHSTILEMRSEADIQRVILQSQSGGARLVREKIDSAAESEKQKVLDSLQLLFVYQISLVQKSELPESALEQFTDGRDVAHFRRDRWNYLAASLQNHREYLKIGPLPDYEIFEIEASMSGWMTIAASSFQDASVEAQPAMLEKIRKQFEVPVNIRRFDELPPLARQRLEANTKVVFFQTDLTDESWHSAILLTDRTQALQFGPFPAFARIEQKAATTTLAFVLLPSALAIAFLLRPIAWQLRRMEQAAHQIASGNLSTRVDVDRLDAVQPLGTAFNEMASRTEALIRSQKELLQAVSHELRTPLTRLRFAIELLETADSAHERTSRQRSLNVVVEEFDHLVGELLNYVRMDYSTNPLTIEPVPLKPLLQELLNHHSPLNPEISMSLLMGPGDEHTKIQASPSDFQRVISNLLANAARFARSKVEMRVFEENNATIIEIDDDGPGIPRSDRQRVFEPFVRLGSSSLATGAGLGLAIVKRVVQQHGNSVEIRENPDGGCRIRIEWKKHVSSAEPVTERNSQK